MKILTSVLGILLFSGVAWGGDYTDNHNGTVTDNASGLMWQQIYSNETKTWGNAISYCESLSLAGHDDWRLPNIKELRSLAVSDHFEMAIDTKAFPSDKLSYLWSSTTYAPYPDRAWYFGNWDGEVSFKEKTSTYDKNVRCVRGGQ